MQNDKKTKFLEMKVIDVLALLRLYLNRNIWNIAGIIVAVLIFILGIFSQQFRDAFLFDKNGKFEWIGVSAIFAGMGLLVNSKNKKREISANLLSKNKLETLNSFKKDVSEFSALIWQYNNILEPLVERVGLDNFLKDHMNAIDDDDESKTLLEEIREKTNQLNEIYFKLKEKATKIELDISEENDNFSSNVIKQIQKLLIEIERFLQMLNESNNSTTDILKEYKIIIEKNNLLVTYSIEYNNNALGEETRKLQMNNK
ncbi:hypothetical protein FKV75_02385 [Weissella paramesenteroides]|uniref:hypothetical protein n=1 Tax=Weissella paramesenteroides TaxID=1249 RepID=UPI00123A65EF|nr:hypothetical protein [Weissella paramesenteroides]KAA8439140.1 hypothetical protein FKV81_08640 [Weissella paramesenteroides]KAA8440152.1 hypothetical protein FKV77_08815 [Weissella paramesenteroides]KAA8443937.1 hypothetical protein FKV75_02385 [Weissella paramesenteroides]KAA8446418.1 hypothetical protein FKV76_05995 [Weissella paramesenteroides]KAA8451488.1 hypothetical protein FKV74_02385 [Weissella paramesenteroides]